MFWRICFFYVLTLLIVGLIVPSNSPDLLGSSGADTKASPFVLAFQYAGVKGLPSVMNAVITISVISVANSCTYASSRTLQAIGEHKMGPRFFTYIDAVGRPLWCVVTQLLFGCLAYIGEAATGQTIFTWLLTFSAMSFFFLWGGINLAHIRKYSSSVLTTVLLTAIQASVRVGRHMASPRSNFHFRQVMVSGALGWA